MNLPNQLADLAITTTHEETSLHNHPIPLVQVQNVALGDLQPYAPTTPNLPMLQYAVTCVMQWAQAQGYPGAIPTWEIITENTDDYYWGVIVFQVNAGLTQTTIPIADLQGTFDPTNPVSWSALVQTWATDNGNQLAIPTFQTDGINVTALVFGADYPDLFFYDAPNRQLHQAMLQPGTLINLQDPAVWANSVMRVANNAGYGAGWPTWQWTTSRGLIGIPAFDYGPLPEASAENVKHVLKILTNTVGMLQIATADSLADYSGIYSTFTAPPLVDEGFQILMDCIFGALQIGLNIIPGVGGALASLVSTALTVAQDAAGENAGTGGSYSLMQYQTALQDASNATINHIAHIHDKLAHARGDKLQKVWEEFHTDTLSGSRTQLGRLAAASREMSNLHHWTTTGQAITSQLNENLMASITIQLYTLEYRTYPNRLDETQFWDGTIASVTAPGADLAQYIADSSGENLSVWFSDFEQEEDILHYYVTMTEWWLQVVNTDDEFPPSSMVYSLFSSDGFGTTTNWTGPFNKATAYTQWFITLQEISGAEYQQWTYPTTGNLVTATLISNDGDNGSWSLVSGYTDEYGNLYLSTDSQVTAFNQSSGYSQPVTQNYLGVL